MSFADVIKECVYENIETYNKLINEKYNIPYEELMNLFFNNNDEKKQVIKKTEDNSNQSNEDRIKELKKKSKGDLQKMCKEINQSDKGKKDELIARIIKGKVETVVDRIKTSITSIIVKKNKFDNYEHVHSGLVFNKNTKCVIGKQDHNTGNVLSLNEDDIEICKQYKFKFNIPKNLNQDDDGDEEILDIEDEEEELEDEEEELEDEDED